MDWIDTEREKLTELQTLLAKIGYKQAIIDEMKKDNEPTIEKQKQLNAVKRKYSSIKRTL